MTVLGSAMVAVFFGFVFGIGCSLAVMYSIYNGGYRAAVREGQMSEPPARFRKAILDLKS